MFYQRQFTLAEPLPEAAQRDIDFALVREELRAIAKELRGVAARADQSAIANEVRGQVSRING